MLSSLGSRLIVSYIVVILVCLLVLIVAVLVGVSRSVQEKLLLPRLESGLTTLQPYVSALLERGETPQSVLERVDQRQKRQGSSLLDRLIFVDSRRQVVADSAGQWVGQQLDVSPEGAAVSPGGEASGVTILPDGQEYLYAAVPLNDSDPKQLVLATVSQLRPWYQVLRQPAIRGERNALVGLGLRVGLLAFAVSVLLALVIARSIARPLQRVALAAEELAQGNYDLHLDITSPDEVRRLAASFNTMARAVRVSQQAQRDFVANVSHELKTPLTSIQGFSQAILDGTADDADAIRQAVGVIYDEAGRMARMVEQLLDLARIEAGQIVMAREPVALEALLQGCVEKLSPQASQGRVTLHSDLTHLPVQGRVSGDGDRLAQVFIILLDNAIKHTPPEGRVSVVAQAVPGSLAAVSVIDTGPGIPAEELMRIFERFYQVDKSRARKKGGTGLGLAIAREIVIAHGGEIVAESVVGVGTKFTVKLPLT
ncbi:MAG: sensor histidine kinase [Chloroflexota bacterium]